MIESGSVFITIGASVVKSYKYSGDHIFLEDSAIIPFTEGFSTDTGITTENEIALINFLEKVHENHPIVPIKAFAQPFFASIQEEERERLINAVFAQTGIEITVLTEKERRKFLIDALFYNFVGQALVTDIRLDGINLSVVNNGEELESYAVQEPSISSILSEYPGINNDPPSITLEQLSQSVADKLPNLDSQVSLAIWPGHMLFFMRLLNYNLQDNEIYEDAMHPSVVLFDDFAAKNQEIFSNMTVADIENLSPQNKAWLKTARANVAIAQGIFQKYSIQLIVPSDARLIDGIIRRELAA